MIRNAFFISLAFLTAPDFISGQTTLSLKAAMQYAVENSSQIRQARIEEERGLIGVDQLLASGYPQMNANAQFVYNPLLQVIFFPDFLNGKPDDIRPVTIGTHWGTSASLEVTQLAFSPEFRIGMKAARKAAALYRSRTEASREELMLQVAKGYFAVQALGAQREMLAANLDRVQALIKVTRTQVENGLGRKTEVDQLVLSAVNLENQLRNLNLQLEQQVALFKFSIQMPQETAIILTDTLREESYLLPKLQEVQPLYEGRWGIRLIDQNQELNGFNLDRYKAGFWPTAYLFANLNAQAQPRTFSDYLSSNSWASFSALGIRLRVPIFDGGLRKSQVESVRLDIRKGEEDKRQLLALYQTQYENALKALEQNLNNLEPLRQARSLAENLYRQSQDRYAQGLAPLTEVMQVGTSLRESGAQVLSALFQVKMAELDLLHANGQLLSQWQ